MLTRILVLVLGAAAIPVAAAQNASPAASSRVALHANWRIQSSCKVADAGDAISRLKFQPKGWYTTNVPATVLAALVADGVYKDPYFGMNLRSIPGTTYPIGTLFSRQPMPDDSPFKCSWWYRTEFAAPQARGRIFWLDFEGINYRANIWLNGRQIATANEVAGAYRTYEFNITAALVHDRANVLAVEVLPPTEKDLAINWVDWSPAPPDKNLGLWRGVFLESSGLVSLRNPQVVSRVAAGGGEAQLTISAELRNLTDSPMKGTLDGAIENTRFQQTVELAAGEMKIVSFAPEQFEQLKLKNPRLWWPYQMGAPNLHRLDLRFITAAGISDEQKVTFGIREVTSELTGGGYRLFKINGKPILIRGGGWAPDMLLRSSPGRLQTELRYVKHMNLNTIRLEGKLETDEFYDLADREGILIMPGWCCCDIWEQWQDWPDGNQKIATESLKSQALRMRNHPSILVWLNGSDNPPVPEVENAYLAVLKETNWPNPVLSSATQKVSTVTGPSGVKMTGPYDWVPPVYWSIDSKHGGAYGFNTETSPGPAVPPFESLRKFIAPDHLWPIDDHWNFHAGGGHFKQISTFVEAMETRYGAASGAQEFAARSQALAYEGERAMFEAYSRNKYTSTGVIQWMLNNAWPSLIWHLYDYYLLPAGGYYGTKKACEPLHVQYSYDDRSVAVVNSRYQPAARLTVSAKVYDFNLAEKFSQRAMIDVAEDSSTRVFTIPEIADLTPTYFVKLELKDESGRLASSNFYWLSTKADEFDWTKTDFTHTPVTAHGDFTALKTLPRVNLLLHPETDPAGIVRVRVKNPTKHLAFMTRLRLTRGNDGNDLLPAYWDDNYISLLPGEEQVVSVRFDARELQGAEPVLKVEGWNIAPRSQALSLQNKPGVRAGVQ